MEHQCIITATAEMIGHEVSARTELMQGLALSGDRDVTGLAGSHSITDGYPAKDLGQDAVHGRIQSSEGIPPNHFFFLPLKIHFLFAF